ncbi:hypothetical protein LTR17_003570 [Elasticomyces elasticus]|nr:hypothetical protein LTR17_003570 [Elasticomyces elasticus]
MWVVVREESNYCIVVPITSYDGRGVGKLSVIKGNHAIIYTTLEAPQPMWEERPLYGEAGMLPSSICVVPETLKGGELFRLESSSRLDYGRPRELDHRIRVQILGAVHRTYRDDHIANWHATCSQSAGVTRLLSAPLVVASSPSTNRQPSQEQFSQRPAFFTCPPLHVHKVISGSSGSLEKLNQSFHRRPAAWFAPGRVMMLLSHSGDDKFTDVYAGLSSLGLPQVQQVGYFLILAAGEESCFCLRILTYQNQGLCGKPMDLNFSDYSIVHTGRRAPELTTEESAIQDSPLAQPVMVRSHDRIQSLDPKARLLWKRIYEIKFDVKPLEFGELPSKHRTLVKNQFEALNPGWSAPALGCDEVESSDEDSEDPTPVTAKSPTMAHENIQPLLHGNEEAESSAFSKGDRVALLRAQHPDHPGSPFLALRIKSAAWIHSAMGGHWAYKLMYADHGGDFCPNESFAEDFLIPEVL